MFSFDYVKDFDPEVAKAMEDELGRQRNNLDDNDSCTEESYLYPIQ